MRFARNFRDRNPISGVRDAKSRVYNEFLFVPNPPTRTAAGRD